MQLKQGAGSAESRLRKWRLGQLKYNSWIAFNGMDNRLHNPCNPFSTCNFSSDNFSWLHVPYSRQRGGSSLPPSTAHSNPFQTGASHQHSKGSVHFNVRFQFSHNPVNMSHTLTNKQYGGLSHPGIKASSTLNSFFLKTGILFHESCSQCQFSVSPKLLTFVSGSKDLLTKEITHYTQTIFSRELPIFNRALCNLLSIYKH